MKTIFGKLPLMVMLVRRASAPVFLLWLCQLALAQQFVSGWGANGDGQLGNGSYTDSITPVQVNGLNGVAAIAPGIHSVALKYDGTVWAWGANFYGQLGVGTTAKMNTPVQVRGLTGVTAIAAGFCHTLALRSDGTVWAWGYNLLGQLGNGSNTDSSVPVQVGGLTDITAISAGEFHSIALKTDGTVWAWGYNESGQVGNGTFTSAPYNTPVQVLALAGVTAISAGGNHNLALRSDGTVWAWGYGGYGELGNHYYKSSNIPVQVSGLVGVTAIAGGSLGFSLARTSDGAVWAWGNGSDGELGDGTFYSNSNVPKQVGGLSGVTAISAGYAHALALKSDGTVWGWGLDGSGQLGDGTSWVNHNTPVQTTGLIGVTKTVAAGWTHSLAIFESAYTAAIQLPIKADGSSVFGANRGVVPVKFTLALNSNPTCQLPPATISLTSLSTGTPDSVNESSYSLPSDSGPNFRVDTANCQYVYNIGASSLGPGDYHVSILINGLTVGVAKFWLHQ